MRAKEATIAWMLLLTLLASSCIEWTTGPNGSLQSFGLPGLPVWQTQSLAEQNRLAAQGDLDAAPGSMRDLEADSLIAVHSDAAWLAEVNRWRTAAGASPVGENLGLSMGAEKHARYLVKNGPKNPDAFDRYAESLTVDAHTEAPGNPYFTKEGSRAARMGDVTWGKDPLENIDGLLAVPFHRLLILAPWERVAGYGGYGHPPNRAAVLVLRGSTSVGVYKPVLYPPDGATMPNGSLESSEWPNPLDACPGYSYPVGLPLTVQLGPSIRARLMGYTVDDETTGREVAACGFDAFAYPDAYGRQVLSSYGAIVIIPRHPLVPGREYRVDVRSHRHEFTWSFRVQGAHSPGKRVSLTRTKT
jgi:hypothetical protein